jgi:hypothetical protein
MLVRRLFAISVVGIGLLALGAGTYLQGNPKPSDEAASQTPCAIWDREASESVAMLVFDSSAAAEWKLDQALLQLRRARKFCRSGAAQIAYHDYASLYRNLPLLTGSNRANTSPSANPLPPIESVKASNK